MIAISRSAVSTRKLCPMKRYWAYHAPHPDHGPEVQVGGLTPLADTSALAKTRGTWFHACMEAAVKQVPMPPAPDSLSDEQVTLIRRAVRGWLALRGPLLLEEYVSQSSEAEWAWSLDPLVTQQLRMDHILRHKDTGDLLILDYKTMSRLDPNWGERMRNSDQTHLYIQALTERTQEPTVRMQYEGILIGTADNTGQKSPFVAGYLKHGEVRPDWVAGSTRVSVAEWDDDRWWDWVQPVLPSLYCTTGPLRPPTQHLLATKAATVHAELQWANTLAQLDEVADDPDAQTALRERLIERNADACLKFGKGHQCPYVGLCWDGATPDPETFVPREDHHRSQPHE